MIQNPCVFASLRNKIAPLKYYNGIDEVHESKIPQPRFFCLNLALLGRNLVRDAWKNLKPLHTNRKSVGSKL